MNKKELKESISRIEAELQKMEDKSFKVMFLVVDSKGTARGSVAYIYETAYTLKEMGYNVIMLYGEEEYVGVGDWLGEKYMEIPHKKITDRDFNVSPSDFIFFPEVYSGVMENLKTAPCKKVAILQNYGYLTDTIPMGATWNDINVRECVTTVDNLEKDIKAVFPTVRVHRVSPALGEEFTLPEEPKKLIINFVARDTSYINQILKTFQWRYPMYNWVTPRDLKNVTRSEFAKGLKESFATVWVDEYTDFGYSAIEAMATGNIVIGKVPDSNPEWMFDKDGNIKDNGLWFYNTNEAADLLARVAESYLHNAVPEEFKKNALTTAAQYSRDKQKVEIEDVYVKTIFAERKKEMETVLSVYKEKLEKASE